MVKKVKLSELENITTTAPQTLSVGDVASQAASNFIPSTLQYGKDVITPLLDPIGTAQSLGQLGLGIIELAIPGEQANEGTAKAVGAYFANRYGGIENLKKTIASDPAGFLGDASVLLTGGASIAGKVGPLTKTAQKVKTVGQNIDPIVGSSNLAGKVVAPVLGTTTSAGKTAVNTAYAAGQVGGDQGKVFRENMRGKENAEVVVTEAREALKGKADARKKEYLDSMDGIKAANQKVDFSPVVDEINKIEKSFEFKGQTTLDKAGLNKLKEIKEAVEIWKNNKNFHTVEGLDALKKKIDNLMPEGDTFGKTSGKGASIVSQARNSVNKIIKEASPEYAKTMKAYEEAITLEKEIRQSLSLGNKASADTALRKLLSTMRNNVNTNFGNRLENLKLLDAAGDTNILERLAGQSFNTLTPRGLQGGNFVMNQVAYGAPGMLTGNPALYSLFAAQSPRLVGELSHLAGRTIPKIPITRQVGILEQEANQNNPNNQTLEAFNSLFK